MNGPEAASAYQFGLQAIQRLLRVQIARHDQETWLRTTQACRFRCTAVSDRMYGKNFVP